MAAFPVHAFSTFKWVPLMRWSSLVPFLLVGLIVIAGGELYFSRNYQLDDAFLHLRAATLLRGAGFPSSDGVTKSFADSSPAFLLLVAGVQGISQSIHVSKLLSVLGYVALFVMLARELLSSSRRDLQLLFVAYLCAIASPFGVRWLSDGMETGLAVAASLALASESQTRTPLRMAMLAACCVLLRVELAFLVVIAAIGETVVRRWSLMWAALAGGSFALVLIALFFGSIVPDAAIAKARMDYSLSEFAMTIATVVVGAGLLGLGPVGCYAGLMAVNLHTVLRERTMPREQLRLWLGAGAFPAILLFSFVRGQAVEGIRTLLPFLFFSLWNATELYRCTCSGRRSLHWPASAGLLLIGVIWISDWEPFERIVRTQVQTIAAMRSKDWTAFQGHTGVAWDVGYLAYFSGSAICDVQGLINGRPFARLTKSQRLNECSAKAEFALADESRLKQLALHRNIAEWVVCDRFAYSTRIETQEIYLLVEPDLARKVNCSQMPADGSDRK